MSRTGWKQCERDAAAVLGCRRFWANAGERADADSPIFACQVKNPKRLSLAELERLVEEMTVLGLDSNRLPVVAVKRSGGSGRPTPMLFVVPGDAFVLLRELYEAWGSAPVGEAVAVRPSKSTMRDYLRELPGMRERVAEYVKKSKKRAQRRPGKKK